MKRLTYWIAVGISIGLTGCAASGLREPMPSITTTSPVTYGDQQIQLATHTGEENNVMNEIHLSRVINAPKDRVWALLADYENIYAYTSDVKHSEHVGGPHRGVGAVRKCKVMMGMTLIEDVVAWEEGRSYTVSIQSPMPTSPHFTTLAVREVAPNQTELTVTVKYGMKGGVFGKAMNAVMLRSFMKRSLGGLLKDIDDYVMSDASLVMATPLAAR